MPDDLAQFADSKYLSLETFRKTGAGVRTPVWFAEAPSSQAQATFYVYTLPDSGQVKRIRNNPSIRIAPCNMRGDVRGEWVKSSRALVRRRRGWQGQELLVDKYGLAKRIGDFFSRLRGRTQCVLAIEVT